MLPDRITIISHEFKRPRFLDLHIPTLHFPISQVRYLGINPPFSASELEDVEAGERERGYLPWKDDPWGTGEVLNAKRVARGWDGGEGLRRDVVGKFQTEEGRRWAERLLYGIESVKGTKED